MHIYLTRDHLLPRHQATGRPKPTTLETGRTQPARWCRDAPVLFAANVPDPLNGRLLTSSEQARPRTPTPLRTTETRSDGSSERLGGIEPATPDYGWDGRAGSATAVPDHSGNAISVLFNFIQALRAQSGERNAESIDACSRLYNRVFQAFFNPECDCKFPVIMYLSPLIEQTVT